MSTTFPTSVQTFVTPAAGAPLTGHSALTDDMADTLEAVQRRVLQTVSVKDFGAIGNGVTDDSAAFQAAVDYCMTNYKNLFVPTGSYLIGTQVNVSNVEFNNWPMFEISGETCASAAAVLQNGDIGSIIVTNGNNAFVVDYDNFNNESIKFSKLSFRNDGTKAGTSGIKVNKSNGVSSYPRKLFFDDLNFLDFENAIWFVGTDVNIFANFIGTTKISRVHTYECSSAVRNTDCYMNLFTIEDCLFVSADNSAILVDTAGGGQPVGGVIMSIISSHCEGCEPAAIETATRESRINLHSFSTEACGVTSGNGAFLLGENCDLFFTGNVTIPGNLEPAPTLPAKCRISSTAPMTIKARGGLVETPDTVKLDSANNDYSYAFFPLHKMTTPYRQAAQYPFSPAAGGTGVPANLSAVFDFTAAATVYDQGVPANTIPGDTTGRYVYASFITKNTGALGFAAGSQFRFVAFGINSLSTADSETVDYPCVCVLLVRVGAFLDVNSMVLVNKAASYASSVYVSSEATALTLSAVGHANP